MRVLNLLRSLQLLLLGLWLGAMVYFSFIVAPALFAHLPTRHLAGTIVSVVLGRLNQLGIVAGVVYLLAAALEARLGGTADESSAFTLRNGLVALMVVLTLCSQYLLLPRMVALRSEMVSIDEAPDDHPLRVAFNRYHRYSVSLATATLLAGLVAFYLTVHH